METADFLNYPRKPQKKAVLILAAFALTTLLLTVSCDTSTDDLALARTIATIEATRQTEEATKPKEKTPPTITLAFEKQPAPACVQKGEVFSFDCKAACGDSKIFYRWFECDAEGNSKKPLTEWSLSSSLTPTPFAEKGIRYFFCAAAASVPTGQDIPEGSVLSDITAAAWTGLPTIYVTTGETPSADITRDAYVPAEFKMTMPDGTQICKSLTKKGIKGRGNNSWDLMPKKGYNLNFDSKESFFGLPAAKKWCLIANYSDKSLLRNKLASVLGNEVFNASWNPTLNSVDFILNGEYLGNYIVAEKIDIGSGRVAVQDISDCSQKKIAKGDYTDQNGDGLVDLNDGGFVLEIDFRRDAAFCFDTKIGVPMTLKDPDEVDETIQEHIKSIVQNAEDVLYGDEFDDTENGWRKYIDEDSVIDWYLVNELAKNRDAAFCTSVYMFFSPSDGKLHLGPNWDFDIAFGNDRETDCGNANGWHIKTTWASTNWICRFFEDSAFVAKVKSRWNEKKNDIIQFFSTGGTIQILSDANALSANLNFARWKILGIYVWPNADGFEQRTTYKSEVDWLLNWLSLRYSWLSSAINGL